MSGAEEARPAGDRADAIPAAERPWVAVNMAISADGKITSAGREYADFTSRLDKATMDRLRAEADAVLVGAGTLRADDPPLQVRAPEMKAYRRSLGKPDELLTVVLSGSLRVDSTSRLFRSGSAKHRIVVGCEDAPADRRATLEGLAEVWLLGRRRVDLGELLRRLKARHVERLLVEGGGETNWSFIERDAVDELYLTLAPCLIGGREAPTPVEGTGFRLADRRRLRLLAADRHGDELFCRFAVER